MTIQLCKKKLKLKMLQPDIHHNFRHPCLYTQMKKKHKNLLLNFNLTFIFIFQFSKQKQILKEQNTFKG